MKGKIFALVLILLVFEALVLLAMYYFTNPNANTDENPSKCDYNNSSRIYINKIPSCVINFLCTQDKVGFSDECGCGCELK